jgi:NodT family efflux transporter outer membrane factor (OMF) lipoprotein
VINSVQAGVAVDWELDLWGRLRRQAEVQDAAAEASLADLANTRLSLEAELATNYFALRVADAQQALLDASVQAYETTLQLTRNRYAAGVVTRADVATAETQWLSAQAQAADNGINRAQLEHAIAVLLGRAPADFALDPLPASQPPGRLELALPQVPAVLPSELLERRPDIASAERQVASANASIGVAQAALFPALTLSAGAGTRGSALADLFSVSNRFWSLGPALAVTLFDAGARRAGVREAEAAYDATVATYRQTVLGALREVEDQLVALRVLEREADLQAQAVRAAGEALSLALNQYRAGTAAYLNVVTAQAADQNARLNALGITGRQLSATVQLVRALGGGWRWEQPQAGTAAGSGG